MEEKMVLGIEDASSSMSVHRLNMLLDGAKALLEFGRSSRGRKGVDGFVDLFVSCVCVSGAAWLGLAWLGLLACPCCGGT